MRHSRGQGIHNIARSESMPAFGVSHSSDSSDAHAITFHEYFATELEALKPPADDRLIELASDAITVTVRGRLLVRSVAMVFDRYLREQREHARYSRVI